MLPRVALLLAAAMAGCASAAPPAPEPAPAAPPVPDLLLGVPAPVVVARALFDLDSGDALRESRARSVLVAIPEGAALEPLRVRFRAARQGSAFRYDALAVLAERGELPREVGADELVEMSLREIGRGERSGRPALLALDRIRTLGDEALPALRDAAEDHGGDRGRVAAAILRAVFHEAPGPAGAHP